MIILSIIIILYLNILKTVKNSDSTFEEISVGSAGFSWRLDVSEKQNENNTILSLNIIK